MEQLLLVGTPYLIHVLEGIGIFIIVLGAARTLYYYVKSGFNTDNVDIKLDFAKSLAFALEFKLAGEILRTVIMKNMEEIFMLGAIIGLRAILTFVIHYEIKFETENQKLERDTHKSSHSVEQTQVGIKNNNI